MTQKIKKLKRALSVLFFSFFAVLNNTLADEITLKNGDKLTGIITTLEKGTLTLETEYSEPIKIKKEKIQSISTDTPVLIYLTGGETLRGKIYSDADGGLTVEGTIERSATTIDWEKVAAINPAPVKPAQWKGNIILGANSHSGNTRQASFSLGGEATRKTRQDRFSLRFLHNYAEEKEEIIIRNTYGSLKYDYFFARSLYGYLGVELLNDKFKNLKLRTVVGPGLGYQIWDDDIKSLLFEIGASYFSEDLKEGEDDSWVTGRLACNFSYAIKDIIVFSDQLIVYPSFEDMASYQLRNEAAIISPLSSRLALKVSNILEHDSDPPVDVKKSDIYWILALQYSF
jgi:putative salt-induced outer membrane protein YdiY/small nuclear ribonucleoprotein (snRNP)-like protein